ncbi:MAG: replication protein [Desulfobacterales bacterium]
MASPQIENGHVKIANELWDALARIRISGEEWQVLNIVIRKTYGWNKKEDQVSLSQFVLGTGLKKPNVIRARQKLLSKKIMIIKKDNAGNLIYRINKDFDQWEPLSKKITVIKKDNKSLSKKIPTKDTTKDNIYKVKTPYQEIVNLYHEILPELPRVVKLTDKRKSQIKARWFESEKTQTLDWWKGYFEMIRERPFLMGNNERGWKADIEFLTTQSKFIGILEGKYK